jgi:hypothetical protein
MKKLMVFFVFISTTLFSFIEDGEEYFLRYGPKVNYGPKILGFQFGRNETTVLNEINIQGLEYLRRISDDREENLVKWMVKGVPKGLILKEGRMELGFFKGNLIQISVFFEPTYEGFLMLRKQFMESLGERFKIDVKKVSMDGFLKAHLASLGSNYLNKDSEKSVIEALKRGNTFWYYKLKDRKDLLFVSLLFHGKKEGNQTIQPELGLYYQWIKGMDIRKTIEKKSKQTILPE